MGVIKVGFLALLARLGLVEQELVDKTARQVLMAQCTAVNVELTLTLTITPSPLERRWTIWIPLIHARYCSK
jgi:hypothetical protein